MAAFECKKTRNHTVISTPRSLLLFHKHKLLAVYFRKAQTLIYLSVLTESSEELIKFEIQKQSNVDIKGTIVSVLMTRSPAVALYCDELMNSYKDCDEVVTELHTCGIHVDVLENQSFYLA